MKLKIHRRKSKDISEVVLGDALVGMDGFVRRVKKIEKVVDDAYKITPQGEEAFYVPKNGILCVQYWRRDFNFPSSILHISPKGILGGGKRMIECVRLYYINKFGITQRAVPFGIEDAGKREMIMIETNEDHIYVADNGLVLHDNTNF